MIWRNRIWFLCALTLSSALSGWAQDIVDSDIVRPSGVNGPVRKAKAVTQKSADDETESAAPKAKRSKSSHTRSHRARAKSKEEPDTIAAPTEFTPDGIPKTSAASVIIVDANSGRILYEKNPDQVRQAASTQKLLTALIVAETGFLDRPVTVQSVDTMCDPVKLGIKSGETYQRIDLLRALLVKSPNDVARCLARDNAGSVEAFAEMMNRRAVQLGAVHSHFVNPNGLPARDNIQAPAISRSSRALLTRTRPSAPSCVFLSLSSVIRMGARASLKTQTNFYDGCRTATA